MQARFLGLDGRPTVLSIRRSRVDWGARNRAFGTIVLCHEPVTVAACHNRDDTPRDKKILAAPPNDHQFYQFHQFHRWGAFSVILAAFLATSEL